MSNLRTAIHTLLRGELSRNYSTVGYIYLNLCLRTTTHYYIHIYTHTYITSRYSNVMSEDATTYRELGEKEGGEEKVPNAL